MILEIDFVRFLAKQSETLYIIFFGNLRKSIIFVPKIKALW